MPYHFRRFSQFNPKTLTINFPESEWGVAAPLNKYLNYVYLLGDPHLGKKFTAGVPLERRGERELMQMKQFHNEVAGLKPGRDIHVTMGDLFDGWNVNNEAIHFAAETYKIAVSQNPGVEFIIIAGNHDLSRDSTKVSAFHLFEEMVRGVQNITVVLDNIEERTIDGLNYMFVPHHPFETSVQYLQRQSPRFIRKQQKFIALGHWDIDDYGRDRAETLGLVPWELFTKDLCEGVITGHDHNRRRYVHAESGVEVFVTGSMQPYAHGQDPADSDDPMYLTLSLAEVKARVEENPEAFKDKCLRIVLDEGEEPVSDIQCLQINFKRALAGQSNDAVLDVAVDSFDLKSLFHAVMDENKVSTELTASLWAKL